MTRRVEEIADWAASLARDDIPDDVVSLARAQRRSVLGAMAASVNDAASRRVLAGVDRWASDGPVRVPGCDRAMRVDDALYAAAALSIALDFDDYACFGHTGHSAVLAPILLAAEAGASADEQLVAHVVANEVEARLGGACLVGPLNGQLWSFIHAAGTALAAGRLLGLDRGPLAHALALALYQAPRPTVPGFMAPDSKLLTAAEPAVAGLRAARLAAAGVTGPLDALDSPEGFLSAFSYAPIPGLLGGLGEGWATRTLCVKPYPGCAYVDTVVDALLSLDLPPATDVARVDVDASLLTIGMDALSRPYAGTGPPSPVSVNFSVAWNVAIVLLGGELTPTQVSEAWLAANHTRLAELAATVVLSHDWTLTAAASEHFARLLPPRAVVASAGGGRLVRALRQVRAAHPSMITGVGDLRGASAMLRSPRGLARVAGRRRFWSPDAIDEFAMTFPARVRVHPHTGAVLEAEASIPRGGAGHPTEGPEAVSRTKLAAWGPQAWGESGTKAIAEAIDTDAPDLWSLLRI